MINKKLKLTLIVGILVLLLGGIIIFYVKSTQKDVIKVGAILPLTGPGSFLGQQVRDGIDLAAEEINAEGGIKGRKLEIIYEDSMANPKLAVTIFNNMLVFHDPITVITAFSGPVSALIPLAEENKVPLLATVTSSAGIPARGEYIFRFFTTADIDAPILAEYAVKKLALNKFAVLYVNDDFGTSYFKVFKKSIEDLGGEIVEIQSFATADTDFRTQLLKIKMSNAEGVYFIGLDNHLMLIYKQAKELSLNKTFLSVGTITSYNVLNEIPELIEGTYATTFCTEKVIPDSFNNKFKIKYGVDAEIYAVFGYDSLRIIANAIERKDARREGVKEGILSIKDFPGVLGLISSNDVGEIVFPMCIERIENGEKIFLRS